MQFRNLANDILSEQTRHFKETNREALDLLLKPFKENIADFRTRVEQIYSTEREQHGELKGELKNLMELNRRITAETTNLTNALKGNSKVQGDWGEMILATILDNSNLIRGVHYDCQVTIKDDEGNNQRPDVVLYLPEGKRIVIDSKVSLTAYVEWVGAEEEAARTRYLAAHVASVRQHVNELSRKSTSGCWSRPTSSSCSFPTNRPSWRPCSTTAPSGATPTSVRSSFRRLRTSSRC